MAKSAVQQPKRRGPKAGKDRGRAAQDSQPAPSPVSRWRTLLSLVWPETANGRRILLAILAAAFAVRAFRLGSMFPILVDESIYLRWAEIIDHQGQWYISLLDGKQPLTYWILALVRKVWSGDPLLAGRLVSVFAGLLATIGIFATGRRLAGETAGLLAAGLYAVFPYALLYDRLAYTEAFVNLFGVAVVLASIECFSEQRRGWGGEIAAGLALGLALFTKQTLLLFAFFPALAGFWMARRGQRNLWARLAVIYSLGALFLVWSWIATPEAPKLATHDPLLHHSGFFVDPQELLEDPFAVAPSNLAKLASYTAAYLTAPAALAALAALGYLLWSGQYRFGLLVSASVLPLAVQVFVLELMFPTRYPFPHFWPWLVVLAAGAVKLGNDYGVRLKQAQRQAALAGAALLIGGPLAYQSFGMLLDARDSVHPADAEGFLGASAHVGFGIREAVDLLRNEARGNGPFVLLTDPIWGPPADALFPYLNRRYGIRVHEAWWMQLSGTHPILPQGPADLIKSHYEREKAGVIDFSRVERVFYVTDTNYYTKAAVRVRQPGARLVASFPKPGGEHSIDVYRLK